MGSMTLAGREFKTVTNSTMRHDIATSACIADAGLNMLRMLPDESADSFAQRIYRQAAKDEKVFLLMGHLFMPKEIEQKDWTPKLAADSAEFFANLEDPVDKKTFRMEIGNAIIAFLASGLISLKTSQTFSPLARAEEPLNAVTAN